MEAKLWKLLNCQKIEQIQCAELLYLMTDKMATQFMYLTRLNSKIMKIRKVTL